MTLIINAISLVYETVPRSGARGETNLEVKKDFLKQSDESCRVRLICCKVGQELYLAYYVNLQG